jgi:hypothetical protein
MAAALVTTRRFPPPWSTCFVLSTTALMPHAFLIQIKVSRPYALIASSAWEETLRTITKIVLVAVLLCLGTVAATAPVKAKEYRHHRHAHYWPGHHYRPYADIPGLTGLIHY